MAVYSPIGHLAPYGHMQAETLAIYRPTRRVAVCANRFPLADFPTSKRFIAPKGAWCQDRGMKTRPQLEELLAALEVALPGMVQDNPDPADFWPAFAGEADVIEDSAESGDDVRYVQERIDQMLASAGYQR